MHAERCGDFGIVKLLVGILDCLYNLSLCTIFIPVNLIEIMVIDC